MRSKNNAWLITAGCGVLMLVAGLATSGRWARETAARTAGRLMSEEPGIPSPPPDPPRHLDPTRRGGQR